MNAFTRFGNTMTSAMIRLGIGPAGMRLLMVRGHKSRLPRTTPVNVIEHQGRRWPVAPKREQRDPAAGQLGTSENLGVAGTAGAAPLGWWPPAAASCSHPPPAPTARSSMLIPAAGPATARPAPQVADQRTTMCTPPDQAASEFPAEPPRCGTEHPNRRGSDNVSTNQGRRA